MATKKHATFDMTIGWVDGGEGGVLARLWGVTHPRLGYQRDVTTSRVCRIEHDDRGNVCEIETRNTIYTRTGMEKAP